jgi:electron transport complex protein RnfE
MQFWKEIIKGLWKENPIFRLVLGMCPTLAVTTSLENALGMGVAATFVLVCSNVVISAIRNLIPAKVRIPCFIVVIASFVTIVDMVMAGFAPELHASLGLFIPLIVVNCIILGRAEAFASKHKIALSIADGIGMGLGFTMGLAIIGATREILGAGSLSFWQGLPKLVIPGYQPVLLMILAPGGFIALGCILALMNHMQAAAAKRKGKVIPPPAAMDCRHCTICKFGS